jgi:hypothetical protein
LKDPRKVLEYQSKEWGIGAEMNSCSEVGWMNLEKDSVTTMLGVHDILKLHVTGKDLPDDWRDRFNSYIAHKKVMKRIMLKKIELIEKEITSLEKDFKEDEVEYEEIYVEQLVRKRKKKVKIRIPFGEKSSYLHKKDTLASYRNRVDDYDWHIESAKSIMKQIAKGGKKIVLEG